MKFGHLELFCINPLESMDFYCKNFGFELVANQNDKFIWIENNSVEILLRKGQSQNNSNSYQESNFGIVLYTENLPSTKQKLEKNQIPFEVNTDSGDCIILQDPNGHWLQIVNPEEFS